MIPEQALALLGHGRCLLELGVAAEFEVAGVKIPISAADLANIQKNGLQFALPEGADVTVQGSIQDFVKAVGKMLGVPDLPLPDPKDIPKPFDQLFGGQINIKITRLSLNTKSGQFAIAVGFVLVTPVKMPVSRRRTERPYRP